LLHYVSLFVSLYLISLLRMLIRLVLRFSFHSFVLLRIRDAAKKKSITQANKPVTSPLLPRKRRSGTKNSAATGAERLLLPVSLPPGLTMKVWVVNSLRCTTTMIKVRVAGAPVVLALAVMLRSSAYIDVGSDEKRTSSFT
jgi:hypothetical protein